jgi:sarcosine oxidase
MRVIVVGGGVFGSWTALWLLRRGASVTLVDQYGPGNALSSSGDESRVTRSAHGPDEHYRSGGSSMHRSSSRPA